MKPPFDIAADLDTPVSAFLKLAPLRPRFLLESVEGGARLGRYSFLGFGDATVVRLDENGLTVGSDRTPLPSDAGARLAALRALVERTPRLGPEIPGLKFAGGLVGAVSYDFVRRLEPVGSRPGVGPDGLFVIPRSLLVFDHVSRRIALLHDGPEADRRALAVDVRSALRAGIPFSPRGKRGPATPSLGAEAYALGVNKVREHITAGDVFQLVLASRFEGETDLHPFQVYRALRLLNPSPYLYYLDLGETQIVGSSPEALVRWDGTEATLRPIAGTRPRGATEIEDLALEQELLADAKEGAEHVMLVDLARNDLGRVALPGSVRVDPYRVIERYSHVMHLVSGVKGTLAPGKDAFDLFAASFPAGTVTGAPKVRAMQLIDELEPVPRGFYAGTVGYFGHGGGMDQAIAIRTLVLGQGRYAYTAGAGIVADSVPEKEYAEVLAKSAALGAALDLAEEGL